MDMPGCIDNIVRSLSVLNGLTSKVLPGKLVPVYG